MTGLREGSRDSESNDSRTYYNGIDLMHIGGR
jgi:hypothetical protein